MEIKSLSLEHWLSVKKIYEEDIATGNATFQMSSASWDEWDSKHLQHSRVVAIENDQVIGWEALTSVSDTCIYAGVAEVSVYIDSAFRGKKIGKALLLEMISETP